MIKNSTLIAIIFLFGGLLTTSVLKAQDPHFSQFYAAPVQMNPALTGVFEGQFRVAANYREQWSSILISNPFRTVAASFDMRHRLRGGDYVAFGLGALRDEAGVSRFTQNQANLSFAFLKQLSGNRYRRSNQYLVAGGQVGLGQNSVEWGSLWFSRQFDPSSERPDQSRASGEPGIIGDNQSTNMFVNFNAGLMYYALFDENRSIYFGASAHHLNSPDISFLGDGSEDLYMKWVAQAGGELPFTDELSLLPAIVVMGQGPSLQTVFGGNFRYNNHDWREVAIRVGAWARLANKLESGINMDALIVSAILEIERFNIGFSYDITTSSLAAANNSRGAFEISLIYVQPSKGRYSAACPKF